MGILVMGVSTLAFSDAAMPPDEAVSADGRAALAENPTFSTAA